MNLEAEVRQVLAELSVCSNGTTTAWNVSGGGKAGSRAPRSGDCDRFGDPPHLVFAERWRNAEFDYERREIVDAARRELERLRKAPRVEYVEQTADERAAEIVSVGEGWSVDEVARYFNTGPKDVRKARRDAGRSTETGKADEESAMVRARALKAQNGTLSTRQIGARIGVSHTTVAKALRQAA